MTATDELRKLLDEHGIHWWAGDGELDRKTHWESSGLTWEYFNDGNGDAWLGFLGACESDITPGQAIAATLGVETCHWEYPQGVNGWLGYAVCSSCGERFDECVTDIAHYCPNCGAKVEKVES